MITVPIVAKEPFSLHWSAIIFENHDPAIRIYQNRSFIYAALLSSGPVLLRLTTKSINTNSPIILSIQSDNEISSETQKEAARLMTWYFSLDDDLSGFYKTIQTDPVMTYVSRILMGLKSPTTPTVFEALIDSIIEQQISLNVARSLEYRFIRKFGLKFQVEKKDYYCYPTPDRLAEIPLEEFRSCGLTSRKGEYIRDIARNVVHGELDLEILKKCSDTKKILESLCSIRGIGRWTAELTMIRGLHCMDAFPADDIALRRMISAWYFNGEKISPSKAEETAMQWGTYKGLASFYLEVAEHCGIKPTLV
jgi:DNA-3-methyladenine glycosylase II